MPHHVDDFESLLDLARGRRHVPGEPVDVERRALEEAHSKVSENKRAVKDVCVEEPAEIR